MRTRTRAKDALRDAEVRTLIARRDFEALRALNGEAALVRAAARDLERAEEDERRRRRVFLRLALDSDLVEEEDA